MKTINEIKNEVALRHGYENWSALLHMFVRIKHHEKSRVKAKINLSEHEDEVIQLYAKQTAIAQREACADHLSKITNIRRSAVIVTPLVTD